MSDPDGLSATLTVIEAIDQAITRGEVRGVKLYQSKADALEAVGLARP